MESNPSIIEKLDSTVNSGVGIIAAVGADMYADRIQRSVLNRHLWTGPKHRGMKAMEAPENISQEAREAIRRYKEGFRAHGRAQMNQGSHPFRRTSNWAAKKMGAPSFLTPASLSSRGNMLGIRRLAHFIDANADTVLPLSGEYAVGHARLRTQIANSIKIRSFGTTAMGIFAASAAYSIARSVTDSIRETGASHRMSKHSMVDTVGFQDNEVAYTTRQRALRAIQNSQSGMRRAFGNESNFLHSAR